MAKANKQPENPNNNCLTGMACPKCGHFGPFRIHVTQSGSCVVSDDGTDFIEGDTDWGDASSCECRECGHTGTVRQFRGEPDPVFDEFQQIVAASYEGGEFDGHSPDDIDDCGDTLFAFLMIELSVKEDCSGFEEAISRLDTAIRELNIVRDAFKAKLRRIQGQAERPAPLDRFTEILQHRIKFWLRGDNPPAELDKCSVEHIERLIAEGYNQGELCLLGDDGDTEYRGWWNIEPCESA